MFRDIDGVRALITVYVGTTIVSQSKSRLARGISMGTFAVTFLVFIAVVAAMAVGVIFSGRRIKGSCGGLAAWKDADGGSICDACADCPDQKKDCELESRETARVTASSGFPVRK